MALVRYDLSPVRDMFTGEMRTQLVGQTVRVVLRDTITPAQIFEDKDGTVPIANARLAVLPTFAVPTFFHDPANGLIDWLDEGTGARGPITSEQGYADLAAAAIAGVEQLRNELESGEHGGGVDDGGIGQLVADPASATAQALAALYGAGIIVVDLDAPEVTEPEGALVIRIGSGPAPEPVVYARDLFERVVAAGWGAADIGGSWTVISTAKTSVSGGRARVQTVASETQGGMIPGFSQDDTEVHVVVALDSPTAGARIARVQQRRQSSTVFQQVSVRQYGSAHASSPGRVDVSFDESSYTTGVLTGAAAGALVHIRSRVTGSAPTTRQVKVWLDGTPEPSVWTATTTTATGPQSGGGYAGLYFYSTGSEPGTAQHSVDLFEVLGV
ncbi:hypothetical protein ACFWE5_03935 [Cellulosimicrobium funkei]|uniref:hypothetical protein n=1 Tax=Cellulosimicrobium funkei TaxID=264251 RepID=UPI003661C5C6